MKMGDSSRPHTQFRFHAVILSIATFVAVSFAGDAEDYSKGILDKAAVMESAAAVTSAAYPDAEEVLLAGATRVAYNPDGTYVQWQEEYSKILTEEAREDKGTIATYFTIPYQRGPEDCSIPLLEIIRPDGSIVPIDVAANSRIMVNPGHMAKNIYNPNDKLLQVGIPGLKIGDTLHFVMFDRIVQPRMKGSWADYTVLESTRPILLLSILVSAPAEMPLRAIALKAPVDGTVTSSVTNSGDRIVYSWTARNVPRMFPEPNMPEPHTVVQRLLVSTLPDWESVSRWYWNLSFPHLSVTPEMAAKVKELVEGVSDRRARLERLFRYVSQDIRYMGITVETTSPGYEPHDVGATFAAKHGVCRDKAALLVAMLREAGFEAFPTLIDAGSPKDAEVPQPYFNHAIVAVRDDGGEYTLMDPTNESTKDLLPAYLSHKSFLVATPEGDRLRLSPVDPAEANVMGIVTRGVLNPPGTLTANTELSFGGINDAMYRASLARKRPDERRRFFEGIIKRASPSARLTDLKITPADPMDTTVPLSVALSFQADDVLVRSGKTALLPLPSLGDGVGVANFVIGQTGLMERKYPLKTDIACGVKEDIEIETAGSVGNVLALPGAQSVDEPDHRWRLACSLTGSVFRASGEFMLSSVEFSPARYLVLKKTLSDIEAAVRARPVFKDARPEPAPDTVIESSDVAYEAIGPDSWRETRSFRKRILTYSGKKSNSELNIPFNEGWETVRVASATVTSGEGTVSVISTNEINVMDQGWVGSAPRYPKGRTLVASFPAVAVGSTIECTLVREFSGRPLFEARESFRFDDPLVRKRVAVKPPAGVELRARLAETGRAGGRMAVSSNANAVAWEAWNMAQVQVEDSMPPWWSFTPTAFVSCGNRQAYISDLGGRLLRAASRQSMATAAARRVTKGARTPAAKLKAIRDAVAMQIRDAGPGLPSLPLSAVSPADRTLADGYGNTTDRAILLHAMLSAAGFEPEFVLASSFPAIPEFSGSPGLGVMMSDLDQVLVRIADPDNPSSEAGIYFNDTDQYDAVGSSPHEDCIAMDLASGRMTTVKPVLTRKSESEYNIEIASSGDAVVRARRMLHGAEFGRENRRFAEFTPEERRRYHQELIGTWSQEGRAEGDLQTDFEQYPGTIDFAVRIPRFAVATGRFMDFQLPTSLAGLFNLRSDTRDNPLFFRRGNLAVSRTRTLIPAGFEVVGSPPSFRSSGPGVSPVSVEFISDTDELAGTTRITTSSSVTMSPCIVEAADYDAFLDLDRRLSHQRSTTALLRQVEVAGQMKGK
jgi:transglutaminase-like putative cysteine protease